MERGADFDGRASRWSGDNLDWTPDGTYTIGDATGGSGFQVCWTPAVSGARTRLQESESIDRRSWPAGIQD